MTLNEAKQFYSKFKSNYPEKIFSLSANIELSDDKLDTAIFLAEQFWLSENISEESAFEKALNFLIKESRNDTNEETKRDRIQNN